MSSILASPRIGLQRLKTKVSRRTESKELSLEKRAFGSYKKNSKSSIASGLTATPDVYTGPRAQKHGWLWRKPFKKNALKQGSWKKCYFILHESFLVWYLRQPRSFFDINPAGCIPLGGCQIFPLGKLQSGFGFEVTHPSFEEGVSLVLRCQDLTETQRWIDQMNACQDATYEHFFRGGKALSELNSSGEDNFRLREILKDAERQAGTVERINEENVQAMEDHLDVIEKYDTELSRILNENRRLKMQLRKKEKSAARKVKRISAVTSKTEVQKYELLRLRASTKALEKAAQSVSPSQRRAFLLDIERLKDLVDTVVALRESEDLSWEEF